MLAAAALHVVALFAGAGFVEAVGAPPDIVRSSSEGTALAPIVISAIAVLLTAVGLVAFSVAGRIRRLPFSYPILYLAGAVLVLRAAALPILLIAFPRMRDQLSMFEGGTAVLCFGLGVLFLAGVRHARVHAALADPLANRKRSG
jgi:hypothetical protein